MRSRRYLPAVCGLLLAAGLLTGCHRLLAGREATTQQISSGQPSSATSAAPGHCTLHPAASLQRQTIQAPGPTSNSTTRTYQLYIPPGTGPASKVPLLISLHGLGANGAIQNAVPAGQSSTRPEQPRADPSSPPFPDGLHSRWFWVRSTPTTSSSYSP